MYISGHNNLVAGSRLHDNNCMGVQFYKPENAGPVTGNVIRSTCAYNNGCAGILAQPGNTIQANVIHHNLVGIQTNRSLVVDNAVWGNGEGGDLDVGNSELRGNRVGSAASSTPCPDGGASLPSPPSEPPPVPPALPVRPPPRNLRVRVVP